MRLSHYIAILLMGLLLSCISTDIKAQEAPDTLNVTEWVYDDVALVLEMFDGEPVYNVIRKVDQFISFGKSATERASTAFHSYKYYRASRIMGYDEIAIYIADNYFLNGRYQFKEQSDKLEMKLFAEYNRRSLIGLNAPQIILQDPAGSDFVIPSDDLQDYSILYFYDDDCASCRKTTPALMQYLANSDRNINFTVYLIYTRNSRENWMEYIQNSISQFYLPENVTLVHLWDQEYTTDFVQLYGVISTPKLFLLDRNNIIKGRELTPNALSQVVELEESKLTPMEEIFEQIFTPLAYSADTVRICKEIDVFFQDSKDNLQFFHELFYTLYQYLKSSGDYTLQQGAIYLAENYIVKMPKMWETVEFTNYGTTYGSVIRAGYTSVKEFIDETKLAIEMFRRNMLDQKVSDLKLYNVKNKAKSIYSIEAEYTVLFFYSMDCGLCSAVSQQMKELYDIYHKYGVEFAGIYTGSDEQWKIYIEEQGFTWINLWDKKGKSKMFNKYDLLDVPAIYLLDKDKKTLAKDINPDVLSVLLEYYTAENLSL